MILIRIKGFCVLTEGQAAARLERGSLVSIEIG
jgi:hypothetical protein